MEKPTHRHYRVQVIVTEIAHDEDGNYEGEPETLVSAVCYFKGHGRYEMQYFNNEADEWGPHTVIDPSEVTHVRELLETLNPDG